MTDGPPDVSVIIPTHDRVDSLLRLIRSLDVQSFPARDFEIIVVADGCTDHTESAVRSHPSASTIHVRSQENRGAAAARNAGAAIARGRLLLFIDDDIEASPDLISAHVQAHRRRPGCAVMGPYPSSQSRDGSFFRLHLRSWWAERFATLEEPGHRFMFRDLLSGNLSILASQFGELGGFNDTIRNAGGEDYEFGARVLRSGIDLAFAPEAAARHHEHETMSLDGSLRRARNEGIATVVIGRLHPELRYDLFGSFLTSDDRYFRKLRTLVLWRPRLGRWFAALGRAALPLLESLRMRHRWRRLYRALFAYRQWCAVRDTLGDARSLETFFQEAPIPPSRGSDEVDLDLIDGFGAAERRLDSLRPTCAHVRLGSQEIGYLSPVPGAERLRGLHLRPALAERFPLQLLRALAIRHTALMDDRGRAGD
jgi:glycosyltransferase involved in cell wall biosynthesis